MISIIGTVGVPACYGGFETLVENLLDEEQSEDIVVYCSSKAYEIKLERYKGAKLRYIPLKANGAQSIPYDIISIIDALRIRSNKLLILGVSGAIILPLIRLFTSIKLVTNIDGLEWKRDKWSWPIRKFLKLSERIAVRCSHVVVADNQAIADYVKSEYGVDSEVIAYGGDHVLTDMPVTQQGDYALSLCRIEPENNCHVILEAFSKSGEEIKFIGNWDNSEYGRSLKSKYASYSNVHIIDPVYDMEKLFSLRSQCKYYVHGHSAGGTNPSLVEIMFFKKNIICFDCSYNRATTENKALYFKVTEDLMALSKALIDDTIGANMLEIAQRRYKWSIVRKQYFNLLK